MIRRPILCAPHDEGKGGTGRFTTTVNTGGSDTMGVLLERLSKPIATMRLSPVKSQQAMVKSLSDVVHNVILHILTKASIATVYDLATTSLDLPDLMGAEAADFVRKELADMGLGPQSIQRIFTALCMRVDQCGLDASLVGRLHEFNREGTHIFHMYELAQLPESTAEELFSDQPASVEKIRAALHENGLSFGMNFDSTIIVRVLEKLGMTETL